MLLAFGLDNVCSQHHHTDTTHLTCVDLILFIDPATQCFGPPIEQVVV
jgi:hypothetical protein